MRLKSALVGLMALLSITVSAQAQTMLTGKDTRQILSVARDYGDANLVTQSNGDPQITGDIDGLTYHVFFRNCTNNTDCEDLNFYLGFLDLKPKSDVINDWNFSKRFSRAYLDDDKDACVEMDIDLVAGVSTEYLDSQFAIWALVVSEFSDHIGYR